MCGYISRGCIVPQAGSPLQSMGDTRRQQSRMILRFASMQFVLEGFVCPAFVRR